MYWLVTAIWRNSWSTSVVTSSSTTGRWLISVERVVISASSRFLKTLAATSAPMVAMKMAALRAPE